MAVNEWLWLFGQSSNKCQDLLIPCTFQADHLLSLSILNSVEHTLYLLVSGWNSKQVVKVSFPRLPPQTTAAFFVNWPVRPSARASNPAPSVEHRGHNSWAFIGSLS